ncbi:PREDICTED: aluminum-activated malate transporter 8-like, partial [Erythranthe guttata]|uniref:aluminum-activated malate transporter 8-like n=1 Tax=Erythranthe guttata TaxID=4155 RepID=UPI00064DDB51
FDLQEASSSELHLKIQPSCKKLSTESGEALRELATALKNKTFPSAAAETHIKNSKSAAEELKRVLENSSLLPTKLDLQEIMPLLVTSSVLIDVVACVERIAVSVNELSEKAGFVREAVSADQKQLLRRGIVKPVDDEHGVVIEINDKLGDSVENMKTVNII